MNFMSAANLTDGMDEPTDSLYLLPEMLFGTSSSAVGSSLLDDQFGGNDTFMSSLTSPSTRSHPAVDSISQRLLRALGRHGQVRISMYAIIFVLAVLGNVLVIVTLAQNRAMRTVTNLFLLNLSVSDLLLAMFCMPFTLIPTLLQDFIFGAAMCVMIRYMQGLYTTTWLTGVFGDRYGRTVALRAAVTAGCRTLMKTHCPIVCSVFRESVFVAYGIVLKTPTW